MTLTQAQNIAKTQLTAAFISDTPKVAVQDYDGVLSFEEARNQFRQTPAVLVSPLTSNDNQIQIAVYVLTKSTDKNVVALLDKVISTLRGLSGTGREPLTVESRSFYDKDTFKTGLRIWVHVVNWTHLANGDQATEVPSPVVTEKNRVAALFPEGTTIAKTDAQAKNLLKGLSLPFVTILSGDGSFETLERRTVFGKTQAGQRFKVVCKGAAIYPLTIKAYAASESEAESLIWAVVPNLPNVTCNIHGFNTETKVVRLSEGQSENGASVAKVEISLSVPALGTVKNLSNMSGTVEPDEE